ncbi:MAG: TrkA family potassium uptake protein [Erysipelotrichia bacterium]|nr:TrkA family potassium uptake protein [Erysipelotrichia bacterium]NCC55547.1 TrkA family potassium uptake protein [Erysipelotrichia bacterium]
MLFKKENKKVIIVGCGRLGSTLANYLNKLHYDVIIIDKKEDSFRKLSDNFSGFTLVGEGSDLSLFETISIQDCHMFIAVTDDDNTNCMLAQIASRIYNINNIYVRLIDSNKEILLDGFHVNAIYPSLLSLKEFERLSQISLSKEEQYENCH